MIHPRAYLRMIAVTVALIAAAMGADAQDIARYSEDSLRVELASLPLHDIEGIWELTADGTTVVIWREHPDDTVYRMELVSGADMVYRPGTHLGEITPTAQPLTYDARIYRLEPDGKGADMPHRKSTRYTLVLEDGAHLSFRKVNSGVRVTPVVIFPSIIRPRLTFGSDRQPNLDGAVKMFPPVPVKGQPRYL